MEGAPRSPGGHRVSPGPRPTSCPACGAELDRRAGTGICDACDWVQRLPAD